MKTGRAAIRDWDGGRIMPIVLALLVATLGQTGTAGAQERAISSLQAQTDYVDEAQLSKPIYAVRAEMQVPVPTRDGAVLSTDIYRPAAEGRYPAILVRSPYSNNTAQDIDLSRWFASRGYVFMYQDVRGKYDSTGEFYPFRHEPNDGYDADEWIGKQPWFNGKLGTMGGSYTGFTQWGQAIRGSRYLVAAAPQVTTPDIYGNWLYTDGALNLAFALSWGGISINGHVGQETTGVVTEEVYRHLPLIEQPAVAGYRSAHYTDWVSHPTEDEYWKDISYEQGIPKVKVPLLTVEGWYDIFLRGALADDATIRQDGATAVAREGKRLVIGPWSHNRIFTRDNGGGEGATDFGPQADFNTRNLYLRWFDYWLKGINNGVAKEPPVRIFVMGENVWRYENEWPLKRAVPTRYYLASGGRANSLHGDGRLSTAKPASTAPTDTYTYDPRNPVPTLGGNSCCAALTPVGPWDQRAAERRDDVLVFSTEALTSPVEVTGPIRLTLYAASSAPDTDFTAKLVDVAPDGFARNVAAGILRARYRETRGRGPGSLIEPGKVYAYDIDVWATSNLFLAGHKIRLEVSSSDFPRFDRNLNTGENPATSSRMQNAEQTIYHSARYPSSLLLPIVPRDSAPVDGPWLGTWQRRSDAPGESARTLLKMTKEGDGFRLTIDSVPPTGSIKRMETTFARFDGKPYVVGGGGDVDHDIFTRVDDHTYALIDMRNGTAVGRFNISISEDGKVRTSVATRTDKDGKQVTSVGVWDRVE